ncbi:MAG: LacI family transcriptional regulator [Sphingobacteriaceae bacterium]|nr:MAG: LacI family transcriptional regulator [Sphingobacteriaceae bacterium]
MKPEVTLKKLSEMLNMSVSTVSRALKNHPDISAQTRVKVKELAEVLEYEPNAYAIHLRTNNSKEFGIIVPAISNYFYHAFISSVEEEARRYGYSVIILQSNDNPEIEQENLKKCKQNRVSGIFAAITSQTENIQSFLKLEDQKIPVIFFDKVPAFEACNKVCVADDLAAGMAAEALLLKKKLLILSIFGNQNLSITKKRLKSYIDTFSKYGSDAEIKIHYSDTSEEAFNLTAAAFSQPEKPDAIFCMSDEILVGVMKAAQKLHLNIPDEVGLIAISDGFIPKLYYPEISYTETSGYKLGKMAFGRMMACLAGSTFAQELSIDSKLIEGGSL